MQFNFDLMKRFLLISVCLGIAFAVEATDTDNIFGIEDVLLQETDSVDNINAAGAEDEDDDNDAPDSANVELAVDSACMFHFQLFRDSTYEAVYNTVWNTAVVNPYNCNLYNMKDTVMVDMNGYTHPFLGRITSNFGMRQYRFHYGTDVKLYVGDTIRSAFDGVVRIARYGKGYGYYVLVRHNNGLETVYGHCSKLLVVPDTYVKSGDPIALGGNTGRSTGSHLHYEIRYVGNPIDPTTVVDFESGLPKYNNVPICARTFKYKRDVQNTSYYVIRKGDTLSGIAKRRGTTVSRLCKLNGIKPNTILKIGRKIRVS